MSQREERLFLRKESLTFLKTLTSKEPKRKYKIFKQFRKPLNKIVKLAPPITMLKKGISASNPKTKKEEK